MNNTDRIITVYAEQTPNPETLKFVVNAHISRGGSFDFPTKESGEKSPLAKLLWAEDYVKGVFIAQDFVTVTKASDRTWAELLPKIRVFLRDYIQNGGEVIPEGLISEIQTQFEEDDSNDSDVVKKVKEILAQNIKPAVEMDGGTIDFVDFTDGVVTVALRGSCSGCPSSMVTLKGGIENLLKTLVPEVTEVVAEAM